MRRIAVVTTSRADYGIYRSLLRLLADDREIELQLIVAGMHLLEEFGHTVDEIEADGFIITERIDMLKGDDSPLGVATSMGRGTVAYAEAFARLRPGIIVVLGDRFEMFAAATAAQPFAVPLAHIHGGELTLGAMDDALRHAITKLSHLHFVSTGDYARRVRQMGEEDWRITVSGAPGLDNLTDIEILAGAELEEAVGLGAEPAPLMVAYHPVTHEPRQIDAQAEALFAAIESSGLPAVFTAPNADEGSRRLGALMRVFVADHANCRFIDNLGTRAWFGLMESASAIVGNSSSGIIEAASFGLPVVNIGDRQQGRTRAANVIDCEATTDDITTAIERATSQAFRDGLAGLGNPYAGEGSASETIFDRLKSEDLNARLLKKGFVDITN